MSDIQLTVKEDGSWWWNEFSLLENKYNIVSN